MNFPCLVSFPICWLVTAIALEAADAAPPPPKLTGIVRIQGKTLAFLELAPGGGSRYADKPILKVGESTGPIEVLRINSEKPEVALRDRASGSTKILTLAQSSEVPGRTLLFANASVSQVLAIYQDLAGRTVIREPALPETLINLETDANLTDEQAGQQLKQAMTAAGIVTVAKGEKFVLAVRETEADRLASIPDPPAVATGANAAGVDEIVFQPGMLRLKDADADQVFGIYQDLSGRTILRPNNLSSVKLTVGSQTALSRRASQWLLATLLQLGGIDFVPEGSKFVFAIPSSHPLRSQLPKFDEKAASIKAGKTVPPGALRCDSTAAQFLEIYANLTGRQPATVPANTSSARFTLRSQGALSPAEAIFALEAVALLNGCRLELIGENFVQISPAGQARLPFRRPTQ
jgi:hypothetical protein